MAEGRKKDAGGGEEGDGGGVLDPNTETYAERLIARYTSNVIHVFLDVLAVLMLAAAAIATYDTVARDFPKFFTPQDEYNVLQQVISNVLLIAIAAELGLLLLYHRTSAAVEVIIFVIARKMVNPEISALELLLSVAALAGLLVVRFYYLPGRPK